MATPLSVKTYLEQLDHKKNTLLKYILRLAVEWKDLDQHLDSTKTCYDECLSNLESERSDFEARQERFRVYEKEQVEMFEREEKKLVELRSSIQDRRLEEEMREVRVCSLLERCEREEKKLVELRTTMEDRRLEEEMREVRVASLLERIEREKMEFVEIQKSVGEELGEIRSRESEIAKRTRILDRKAKELDLKEEKLSAIEKLNEERMNELRLKDEKLKVLHERMMKRSEEESQEIRRKEKHFEELLKNFESNTKRVDDCFKDFESNEALPKERLHEFESRKKQHEDGRSKEQCKDRTSKDSGLEKERSVKLLETSTQTGSKSKKTNNFVLKKHQIEDVTQLEKDVPNLLTTDGKSLQIYLNENLKNSKSISGEVHKILQLATDPARLVLDAMVGFYPPHLKVGDNEFETDVVRRSCNLLLGNLRSLSPPIGDHVKEEALRLAGEWKVKMEAFPEDPLTLLAIAQVFASFKLGTKLNATAILGVMELVPLHITLPELCKFFGLQENVSDIIKKLIENNQHLVAVRYIISYGLVNDYQPVPLLKNYINITKKLSTMRGHVEHNSCESQDGEIDDLLNCIRAVISCILDYKVECGNWCIALQEGIIQLQEWKVGKRIKPFDFNSFRSLITGPDHSKSAESLPVLPTVLRNMDGKNLLLFLSRHVEDHESIRKDVSVGLRMSPDPGKIVLDALWWFYPRASRRVLDDRDRLLVRSCNFLLDVLVKLSPVINPEVEKEARKLVEDWKTNIEIPIDFDPQVKRDASEKLIDIRETNMEKSNNHNVHHRQGLKIHSSLRFVEKVPAGNSPNNNERIKQPARKDEQVYESFSSSWDPIQCASDPFALILDVMESCYHTNLGNMTYKTLENTTCFTTLLSQLLGARLVVTTPIKVQAMNLVADWKLRMNRKDPLQLWCFLLFLATYELASSCTKEELLGFLEIVYYRKEAVDVFRRLGLESEVPNFIRRLVEKGFHLAALEFVNAFNLASTYPPINFLKGFILYAKEEAEKLQKKENYSLEAEEVAAQIKDKAIKEVKNYTSLQNLGLENTFRNLKLQNEGRLAMTLNPSNCQLSRYNHNDAADIVHTEPQVLGRTPNTRHEKKRKSISTDNPSHDRAHCHLGRPSKKCKECSEIQTDSQPHWS